MRKNSLTHRYSRSSCNHPIPNPLFRVLFKSKELFRLAIPVALHAIFITLKGSSVRFLNITLGFGKLTANSREALPKRRLLWKSRKELTPQENEGLCAWLKVMPDLTQAYFLKQQFKRLWNVPRREEALGRYARWRRHSPQYPLYAFKKLLTAVDNWKCEIFSDIDYHFIKVYKAKKASATRERRDIPTGQDEPQDQTGNTQLSLSGTVFRRPYQLFCFYTHYFANSSGLFCFRGVQE